jgi:hypothetical protein
MNKIIVQIFGIPKGTHVQSIFNISTQIRNEMRDQFQFACTRISLPVENSPVFERDIDIIIFVPIGINHEKIVLIEEFIKKTIQKNIPGLLCEIHCFFSSLIF